MSMEGLGLFENSRIMDLLASLSFFLGILFVWVVFAVLSVVFGCLVLRKEPDKKNTAHGCGRHSAESSGICRPRCLYECLGAIRRGLKNLRERRRGIIALRAILTLLIHWEIKNEVLQEQEGKSGADF